MVRRFWLAFTCTMIVAQGPVLKAAEPGSKEIEFFETKIRPVLAEHCYQCHSADAKKLKGGLRLDSSEAIRRGGESGPVVAPGDPVASALIEALRYEGLEMPPDGRLPADIVADFVRWVGMGAPMPEVARTKGARHGPAVGKIDLERGREFWAFRRPLKGSAPDVRRADWPRNEIDRFLLARLEADGLGPVADADRRTLLRRVMLDVIGLPPTPEEVDAFVNDTSPDAYEFLVDLLLASPSFGERWGRHWLDIARFAESTGKELNYAYPYAWRYRDYVIDSLNRDKPFDQFVKEQVAGDLMLTDGDGQYNEQLLATGFLTLAPRGLNEKDREQVRMDVVDDQIEVTCRAVLALTVNCARCHDHKFDPIPTTDYYALAGIFGSTETLGGFDETGAQSANMPGLFRPLGRETEQLIKASSDHKLRVRKLAAQLKQAQGRLDEARKAADADEGDQAPQIDDLTRSIAALESELRGVQASAPPEIPATGHAMAVRDAKTPEDCRVCIRGDITTRGEAEPRGFISVLQPTAGRPSIPGHTSGRLELAGWLADERNPLTARVFVNRVWYHLFGAGLVRTVDNFGAAGERPSHPELLDHLAVEFVERGWSVKQLIRTILLSHAYQLGSDHEPDNFARDPDNRLLWRMSRRRLDAEVIRDSILAISGQLDPTPPLGSALNGFDSRKLFRVVTPVMPAVLAAHATKRSIYLATPRSFMPEFLQVFDVADPNMVVGHREVTTVPAQALHLLNSPFVLEQAQQTARRLLTRAAPGTAARADLAYRLILGRPATPGELDVTMAYVRGTGSLGGAEAEVADWAGLCQILFASAEFRYTY